MNRTLTADQLRMQLLLPDQSLLIKIRMSLEFPGQSSIPEAELSAQTAPAMLSPPSLPSLSLALPGSALSAVNQALQIEAQWG